MIKKIIKFPAPSLKSACKPIDWNTVDRKALLGHIRDLQDTLDNTVHGVALASNQILPQGFRVFVVRPGIPIHPVASMAGDRAMPGVFVNPRWSVYPPHEIDLNPKNFKKDWAREHFDFVEGCLSIPELSMKHARDYWVEIEYDDFLDGRKTFFLAQGLAARIIQHECDHLDGKLLYDYASDKVKLDVRMDAIKNRKMGR